MTETQLRFLRAIAERVALARVAELYLFPPMRQGNMESGIAVVAAVLEERESGIGSGESGSVEGRVLEAVTSTVDDSIATGEACDPTEDASRGDDAPVAPAVPDSPFPIPDSRGSGTAAPPPRLRHTVYTARYRLTLKGPERGRWELHVMEEADAPLLSVDLVVRGVQRRIGEGAEPERLEPAALRELLETPVA
jgi:hypothetical protein